jgi:hypothetical protein
VELGNRPYGPELTAAERDAIGDRVSVIGDRLLLIHEVPVQTPTSVGIMLDRVEALSRDWDRFAYVLDLSEARRPDAEVRAALKARLATVSPRVVQVAAVVAGNRLMRAMARLVGYGMGLTHLTVHEAREQAIAEARRALDR